MEQTPKTITQTIEQEIGPPKDKQATSVFAFAFLTEMKRLSESSFLQYKNNPKTIMQYFLD